MNIYDYMEEALKEAKKAASGGDIPVGAVVVLGDEIIARGANRRERDKDPMAHAECVALRRAAKRVGDWRLAGCDLYVTLEPCPMCAGALLAARVKNVYFGAYDRQYGALGGVFDLSVLTQGVSTKVFGGIMADACQRELDAFFEKIRK